MNRNKYMLLVLCLFAMLQGVAAQSAADGRYADHSVLAMGHWVKIRVPETGLYVLTDELLMQAGFDQPEKVHVYGYGGARQPEQLTASYLKASDDLKEVATCYYEGQRLLFAIGPVNWSSATAEQRELNNYSSYGYYFLTDCGDDEPYTMESSAFFKMYEQHPSLFHALHEIDNFAWYQGGRQLFEAEPLAVGVDRTCRLKAGTGPAVLTVGMVYSDYCDAEVLVDGQTIGHILVDETNTRPGSKDRHPYLDKNSNHYTAMLDYWKFTLPTDVSDTVTVTLRKLSGATMHPDYIALCTKNPRPLLDSEAGALPEPELMDVVSNQDHHADTQVDMVIIVPTSRQLTDEARRLKELHEQYDGMTVRIVPANELYNEFSSGTPDANAYRRYMKMLYDRAEGDESLRPHYLLLLGDGAWDNRMLVSDWNNTQLDDFLLTFESDNSFSETQCYSTDDYYCFLDDDEGASIVVGDKADVAVGRLPARTAAEAKVMVDKTIAYRLNENSGDWQNTICFMADDGNENLHMQDAEYVIDSASIDRTAFRLKKIYWDAYPMTQSSKGNDYPDVRKLIKEQMRQGALIMDYTGHGSAIQLSTELCVVLDDFGVEGIGHLPLWFMAACDIIPFNTQRANMGEVALKNPTGGAIAVISTVHTVYAHLNRILNKCLMRRLLGTGSDGRAYTIGEALRQAKQAVFYERRTGNGSEGVPRDDRPNHLQYVLLGDPALRLNLPDAPMVVDAINGEEPTDEPQSLYAGQQVTVEGHLPGHDDFNGVATITLMDAKQTVTGRVNNLSDTKTAYSWADRPYMLFHGTDSVRNGQFSFTFTIPKDITYSDSTGLFYLWAVDNDRMLSAHGRNGQFSMGDSGMPWDEGDGPEVMCYLDNALFENGGIVGASPYFYAEIYDPDGINVSEIGIGHDMELIIDGRLMTTYTLNNYFEYALGDYCRGTVGFVIPELSAGDHTLLFRVWDMLNNSSATVLSFVVGNGSEATPHEASGLEDVRRATTDNQLFYDSSGRRVVNRSQMRRGVYLSRDSRGAVKKLMVGGQ